LITRGIWYMHVIHGRSEHADISCTALRSSCHDRFYEFVM
jgi:hypothetical protein